MATLDQETVGQGAGLPLSPAPSRRFPIRAILVALALAAAAGIAAGYVAYGGYKGSTPKPAAAVAAAPSATAVADAAYVRRVRAAMQTLNTRRAAGRRALRAATRDVGQQRATRALAGTYAAAARAVAATRPSPHGQAAGTSLTHALKQTRGAYAAAAVAAGHGNRADYAAATRAIARGEAAVAGALSDLRALR